MSQQKLNALAKLCIENQITAVTVYEDIIIYKPSQNKNYVIIFFIKYFNKKKVFTQIFVTVKNSFVFIHFNVFFYGFVIDIIYVYYNMILCLVVCYLYSHYGTEQELL